MNVEAINNYCIVEMLKPKEEIKNGLIYIPSSSMKAPRWGRIKSVGAGVPDTNGKFYAPDVKKDDLVYVAAHGQFEVYKNMNAEDDDMIVASALDMLAIMKDEIEMEIQPLGSYIEIERLEIEEASEQGIVVADAKKAPSNIGIVKSVGLGWRGPDGTPIPFQVKVGDKIIFNPLRVMIIDLTLLGVDKEKTVIMHNDIIGVVND